MRLGDPPRLLIVDDEKAVLFGARQYFMQAGYEVDCASDSSDARALVTAVCYSVIVTDLCLTGKADTEGLDVIRYTRERCPDTQVILLTAHGSPEIEQKARTYGAHAVLSKPMALPDLERAVAHVLRGDA